MDKYVENICKEMEKASSLQLLEDIRQAALGKQGTLSQAMTGLKSLSEEQRRLQGAALNDLKKQLQQVWARRKTQLEQELLEATLVKQRLDTTCPAPVVAEGCFHPLMHTLHQVVSIFSSMGFSVRTGPDVEDVYHNFTALNVGEDHPARASQDTFYLHTDYILRTQTSPVQIRTMKRETGPLRVVVPGRVYRVDDMDMTHTPMFHQLECLALGEDLHMGHLKGCLEQFLHQFFGMSLAIRFRPSFFPFTEPSAEVDIPWQEGKLQEGQDSQWLEILGCGMVHPTVLRQCGLDPAVTRGFAAGMGIERLAMLKYGITDIRHFYINSQPWLHHLGLPITSIL